MSSIFIIIAGILWGIISVFVTSLKSIGFSSMEVVALRVIFSAIILVIYLLVTDRSKLKIKLKDIPLFCGTGICSIVFFNFCYFQSIEIIGGAAIPALLLYTAPIFVMFMSLFLFKENITVKKVISLLVTILGMCFLTGVFSGKETITLEGFLYGLGAGFGYALYSIFGKFLLKKYDSMTITTYTFVVASVAVIPFSGIIKDYNLMLNTESLLWSLGLALVCTILPFILYTKGLLKIEAGKASILATVEPFVAAIIGVTVFSEGITVEKIIGMVLILFAIILLNINIRKAK